VHSRSVLNLAGIAQVLVGASGALAVMTVISVVIGKLFQRVPAQLQTSRKFFSFFSLSSLFPESF
jgi:putative Ca2+/H+ antiporter (TMEM165/GDT1 family)